MIEGLVELRARHSGDARGHPQPGLAARSLDDAAQPRGPGIETRVELADLAIADAQQAPSPGNEKSPQRRADHGDLVDAERAKIIPADVAPFDDPQSGPVSADGNVARRIGHHALPHAGSRSALIPFEKVPTALVVPPCRSVIPSDPKPGQAVLGTSGNEGGQIGQAPASASRFPLSRDVIIENPDGAVAATAYRRRIAYWQGRMGHSPRLYPIKHLIRNDIDHTVRAAGQPDSARAVGRDGRVHADIGVTETGEFALAARPDGPIPVNQQRRSRFPDPVRLVDHSDLGARITTLQCGRRHHESLARTRAAPDVSPRVERQRRPPQADWQLEMDGPVGRTLGTVAKQHQFVAIDEPKGAVSCPGEAGHLIPASKPGEAAASGRKPRNSR